MDVSPLWVAIAEVVSSLAVEPPIDREEQAILEEFSEEVEQLARS